MYINSLTAKMILLKYKCVYENFLRESSQYQRVSFLSSFTSYNTVQRRSLSQFAASSALFC